MRKKQTLEQLVIKHLTSCLSSIHSYVHTEHEQQRLETGGTEQWLYEKITRARFRKWRLPDGTDDHIRDAINRSTVNGEPLLFTFPFGGYKLWRLPSAPEVDWAELFTISYYLEWLSPIAHIYRPGFRFVFSSDDVIIERMNRIPQYDTDQYILSFQQLLFLFQPHLPDNVHISIQRVGDLYQKDIFEAELKIEMERVKKLYEHPDPTAYDKMLRTSELNVNDTGLTDQERTDIIRLGPVYHDAYGALTRRKQFVRAPNAIVVFPTPIRNAIAVGTTKNSVTKFWTGEGVIEKQTDGFTNTILSPTNLKNLSETDYVRTRVTGFPGKNFSHIRVKSTAEA